MIARSLLAIGAVGIVISLTSPVFAAHCPADMKAIDQAVSTGLAEKLSSSQRGDVEQLRKEGEQAHKAGQHSDAVNKLSKAMRILLSNQ